MFICASFINAVGLHTQAYSAERLHDNAREGT
jgi:hypothetical protein